MKVKESEAGRKAVYVGWGDDWKWMGGMVGGHPWGGLWNFVCNETLQSEVGLVGRYSNVRARRGIAKFVN